MARRKKKRIASRGSVNSTILKTLINGDKYGYEIIKEVEEYSDGRIVLKQPSLYSSLSRFEEKGIVTSYWGDSDIGGRRHYYHLTEKGFKYYQVSVLKMKDLDDEDEDESVSENKNDVEMIEIKEDEVPAIVNFESKTNENIPDHNFTNTKVVTHESEEEISKKRLWNEFIQCVKKSNKKCANTKLKKLHYNKPSKKVVLDSDGIYKLRDANYQPHKHKPAKSKIVDNVGKRINSNNYIDTLFANNKNTIEKNIELTDEEKMKRNQLFVEKFNLLSESKLEKVSPPKPEKIESPIAEPEKEIDYRSKLDKLLVENQSIKVTTQLEENNLFNYVDEDVTEINEESIEDKFINFDSEDFETKTENLQYIEEITNYSTSSEENLKISRYENKAKFNNCEKSYVLINKVRCIFGLLLLILFVSELTISLLLFKNLTLFQEGDNLVFIYAFVISSIIALAFMIPIMINPNEHKQNTFKLKYILILGILTFLVSLILIYCINALLGFELDNFNYFAVRLIIPSILSFNFVIAPPIYALLINNKRFYD